MQRDNRLEFRITVKIKPKGYALRLGLRVRI